MSPPSYSIHNRLVLETSTTEATASQLTTSAYLHNLQGVAADEVTDVTVTCDGTWLKRGFTAIYGAVVVASWESGQVLDVEILCKYCSVCAAHQHMDQKTQEYEDWYEAHKDSCETRVK